MDLDKRLFLSIPRTFRSSMPMMENLLASDVVSWCSPSCLILAILAWSLASFRHVFSRLFDPRAFRERLRESRTSVLTSLL